jgi:pantetheine-phosphate adenylyltransferase
MRRVIYPGSFDPITNGHLDVITRAQKIFDEVIVAIAANESKKTPIFSLEERRSMVEVAVADLGTSVKVTTFSGLLMDFAQKQEACAVVRGLRAVSDFEFETQMALMNRKLAPNVETIFLMPRDTYTYLSSSIIKEIAKLGGSISSFVPEKIEAAIIAKLKK